MANYSSDSGLVDGFFDAATRTRQSFSSGVGPTGKHQTRESRRFLFCFALLEKAPEANSVFITLSILGAAVFTQPPVSQIEEMVGFFHGLGEEPGCRG